MIHTIDTINDTDNVVPVKFVGLWNAQKILLYLYIIILLINFNFENDFNVENFENYF